MAPFELLTCWLFTGTVEMYACGTEADETLPIFVGA